MGHGRFFAYTIGHGDLEEGTAFNTGLSDDSKPLFGGAVPSQY